MRSGEICFSRRLSKVTNYRSLRFGGEYAAFGRDDKIVHGGIVVRNYALRPMEPAHQNALHEDVPFHGLHHVRLSRIRPKVQFCV